MTSGWGSKQTFYPRARGSRRGSVVVVVVVLVVVVVVVVVLVSRLSL